MKTTILAIITLYFSQLLYCAEPDSTNVIDPQKLYELLLKSEKIGVRLALTEKINNQAILTNIAKTDNSPVVRCTACNKIISEITLLEIIHEDADDEVKLTATSRIKNQNTLIELFNTEKSISVKWAAVTNLTIQSKLKEIAFNEEQDRTVREAAIKNINNQQVLGEIALNNKSDLLRWAAAQRVTDKGTLHLIINNYPSKSVRSAAQKSLTSLPE